MSNKSGVASQVLPLPQGGGAISGIGETFSPDLFTGTGNFSVPIALPPGRNGFQPKLSLAYSTGNGNGPFGLGWSLGVPAITRKTSRGLPRYRDNAQDLKNRDTFILSGAEDLVQVTERDENTGIARFRPRTEGLFAEIEHVLNQDDGTNFWRVRNRDGLVSLYGTPVEDPSDTGMAEDRRRVIAHPSKPEKVFAWMLSETHDPFGNRIQYSYLRDRKRSGRGENGEELTQREWDQLYLAGIHYVDLTDERFLVSVKFIYDEKERPDAFSSYRSGFEIRTRRRCGQIEVHTAVDRDRLMRKYRFTYLGDPALPNEQPRNGVSLLGRIEVVGDDGGEPQALAPLDFGYTSFDSSGRTFQPLSAVSGALPGKSLADDDHELVDLYGRGLPDLVEMTGLIRFWRNKGEGHFINAKTMETGPHAILLREPGVQFSDLNGDGRIDLLVTESEVTEREGYFPLRFGGEFFEQQFVETRLPSFDLAGGNTRFLDLNGDGVVDALRTDNDFRVFFNRAEQRRWDSEVRSRGPVDENLRFENPKVKLADLSGDGLQDFVFVNKGGNDRVAVRYWPNLGDGRFGEAIDIANGPQIRDNTAPPSLGFEPTRLLLGDIDGDGLDDLLYIHLQNKVLLIWINQSGNGWPVKPIEIPIPSNLFFEAPDAIRLADMLGTGTAGILWTADRRPGAEENYQFLDLTGGVKPYLLTEMNNNMGAITRVQYAPSTKFYLADEEEEEEGTIKWKTPLPFPVQVVERVEVIDELSKSKLTTEYRYHHGYWNGTEREFRGFGMVEQRDTESRDVFNAVGLHGSAHPFNQIDEIHFSPPTLTKTWFHLGDIDDETLDDDPRTLPEINYVEEYFEDDPPLLPRPEDQVAFFDELPRDVRRGALRTLRGTVLRTELYALDDPTRPFTVTETLTGLREVEDPVVEEEPEEEPEAKRKRIFFPHPLAQRITQWERGHDPMTRFTFTDDYDAFGQPRRQTQIACPRGWRSLKNTSAEPYLATQTRTMFARPPEGSDVYIVDRAARSTSFEIVNDGSQTVMALKDAADSGSALQVVGQSLSFYDGPAFIGLPNGEVGEHGALVRTESLVLTEEILKEIYKSGDPTSDDPKIPPYLNPDGPPPWTPEYPEEFRAHIEGLPQLAGFTFHPGDDAHERGYFATSTRNAFDFQLNDSPLPRGLLRRMRDPLGDDQGSRDTTIDYDAFDLLPVRVIDPVGLVLEASYDPRVLQPDEVIDPNGNRTHYTYTPLGLLKEIAVLGKEEEFAGDEESLPDNKTRVVPSTRFEYDFLAFVNSRPDKRIPISVHTVRRVHHVSETDVIDLEERNKSVETIEYSDGFGRLLQTRTLAEDDTVGHPIFGGGVLSADQSVDPGEVVLRSRVLDDPNVVVSGAQVYDNKGRVVEKFEPYFELESGFAYRPPGEDQNGQPISMFYDPLGRVIRTLSPDGSEQRVIHGVPGSIRTPDLTTPDIFEPTPWEAYTYDANDLAPVSREPQADGSPGPLLTERAPRHHHFTPSSILVDALGRTILAVARNREAPENPDVPLPPIEEIETRFEYDIRGNVLKVIDARKREAFTYVYDLANNALRTENIDARVRRVVLDGGGKEIERRDSKGAVILQAYDRLQRATRLWARDDKTSDVTLRERLEYGDGGDPDQNKQLRLENRALNRLGTLNRHYDEAGLMEMAVYDFKGNVLEKSRRVIRDEAILAVFPGRDDPDRKIRAFLVNWDPLEEQEQALLVDEPYETSATYDALNRVKRLLYPRDVEGERKELRPTYNRAGALESVTLDGKPFVEHIAYDAKGQRTFVALGSRVMTLYAYEPRTFRLSRMFSTRFSTEGERTFRPEPLTSPEARKENLHQDFGYDYDLAGNITRIRDRTPESGILNARLGRNALDRTFKYDALYRLTFAAGREVERPPEQRPNGPFDPRPHGTDLTKTQAYDEHYKYDVLGNLERLQHVAGSGSFTRRFTLKPGNNQLDALTIGNGTSKTFTYRYDDNGNLVQENTERHFEWDHSDRMKVFRTQVEGSEPSLHAHYLYDASGQRVKKLVRKQNGSMEVTDYIEGLFEHHRWQRNGREPEANNRLHVMDDQQRIAMIRVGDPHPEDRGPDVQYPFGDHLGSSNVVVSTDGSFINHEEYTPYGETSFGSFARKRYRFTGKERDEESGLSYHEARYFAPWLARWISCDPAGAIDSSNLYLYTTANPMRGIDRYGLQTERVTHTDVSSIDLEGMSESEIGLLDEEWPGWREGATLIHGSTMPNEETSSFSDELYSICSFDPDMISLLKSVRDVRRMVAETKSELQYLRENQSWFDPISDLAFEHSISGELLRTFYYTREKRGTRWAIIGAFAGMVEAVGSKGKIPKGTKGVPVGTAPAGQKDVVIGTTSQGVEPDVYAISLVRWKRTVPARGRGVTQSDRQKARDIADRLGHQGLVDVGHAPQTPQVFTRPGDVIWLRAEPRGPNRREGATRIRREAARVRRSPHLGIPVRPPRE